jgi:hypothetical protein
LESPGVENKESTVAESWVNIGIDNECV